MDNGRSKVLGLVEGSSDGETELEATRPWGVEARARERERSLLLAIQSSLLCVGG